MKKKITPVFLLILILVSFSWSCGLGYHGKILDANKVSTESGGISGTSTSDGIVRIFMGVPFAAPPVGDLRWKAPQPVKPWKGIRACITPPASAMQAPPRPFYCWSKEFMAPEKPLSEDCLYLNVWTPAKTSGDKLPVMVWIHGGAFTGGSGTVPLYDGENMARKGVVFITINYRLGIFGFFAHPDLSAESPDKVSGNYGILDQMEALRWIQKNIEAFGGDPGNVTIAGQSAGSFSVNVLVVSPKARGLFHKAIAQSGGMFGKNSGLSQNRKSAEENGKQWANKTGFSSLTELRKIPADSLMKTGVRFGVIVDSVIIPPVYETFMAGKQNDVPVISGWNADDGVFFGAPATAEKFRADSKRQYGDKAEEFLRVFPAGTDEEARQSQKMASVLSFGWHNYSWAKLQSETGKGKSYLYFFKRVPPGEPNYGAFHSAEFGYALHNLDKWDRPFTDADRHLEEIMSSYWVNFARSGNPNGPGLPEWPSFNSGSPVVMEFDADVKSIPLPYKNQLLFYDKLNK